MATNHNKLMKSLKTLLTLVAATSLLAFAPGLQAQENASTDPTGTWSWNRPSRGGGGGGAEANSMKSTLTLKAQGETLTGELTSPGRRGGEPTKTTISEGTVKEGKISFKVNRTRGTNTFTMIYTGTVKGDAISGTMGFERNGETREREWSATRKTDTE